MSKIGQYIINLLDTGGDIEEITNSQVEQATAHLS